MTSVEQQNFPIGLSFSIQGDIRFISHRDTIRLWQKALIRADIPVRYSQGFNPHMRLSLPLPRSVGMASNCELLMIYPESLCCPEDIINRLRMQLPVGITINSAKLTNTRKPPMPVCASYSVLLGADVDKERLISRLHQFYQADECLVSRVARRRHPARTLDLKQFVDDLKLNDNNLTCSMKISPRVSARVDELLKVLGLDNPATVACITRTAIDYAA